MKASPALDVMRKVSLAKLNPYSYAAVNTIERGTKRSCRISSLLLDREEMPNNVRIGRKPSCVPSPWWFDETGVGVHPRSRSAVNGSFLALS